MEDAATAPVRSSADRDGHDIPAAAAAGRRTESWCALSVMLGSCRCGSSYVFCVSLHIGVPRRRAPARAGPCCFCRLHTPPPVSVPHAHSTYRVHSVEFRLSASADARSQINSYQFEDTHIHTDTPHHRRAPRSTHRTQRFAAAPPNMKYVLRLGFRVSCAPGSTRQLE